MAAEPKKGDAVVWDASQGTVEGRVERKLTRPIDIQGHHVAASDDDPKFLVRSDRTGAAAAHRPSALKKTSSQVDDGRR